MYGRLSGISGQLVLAFEENMRYITDVHAHYDEAVFDKDRAEVLDSLHKEGVAFIINSGSEIPSSKRSVKLAEEYDYIFASVGVFPLEAETERGGGYPDWLKEIERLSGHEKTVAIGEIGLDYRMIDEASDKDACKRAQKEVFAAQIELSKRLLLPVVIHSCEADEDLLSMLDAHPCRGMIHRYYCMQDCGRELLDRGFYIGIGPQITYPGSERLTDIVKEMPAELMLLETDAPFLPNYPLEGRATSAMIEEVCRRIAEIRGDMTPEEAAVCAMENAKRLFGIA